METNRIEQTVRTDVRLGCRYDVLAFVCARPSASRRAEYALWQKSCIVSICCANSVRRMPHMVDIAQPVEQLIVVQQVARSSRVIHPTSTPRQAGFLFSVCAVRHVAGHGERSGRTGHRFCVHLGGAWACLRAFRACRTRVPRVCPTPWYSEYLCVPLAGLM